MPTIPKTPISRTEHEEKGSSFFIPAHKDGPGYTELAHLCGYANDDPDDKKEINRFVAARFQITADIAGVSILYQYQCGRDPYKERMNPGNLGVAIKEMKSVSDKLLKLLVSTNSGVIEYVISKNTRIPPRQIRNGTKCPIPGISERRLKRRVQHKQLLNRLCYDLDYFSRLSRIRIIELRKNSVRKRPPRKGFIYDAILALEKTFYKFQKYEFCSDSELQSYCIKFVEKALSIAKIPAPVDIQRAMRDAKAVAQNFSQENPDLDLSNKNLTDGDISSRRPQKGRKALEFHRPFKAWSPPGNLKA